MEVLVGEARVFCSAIAVQGWLYVLKFIKWRVIILHFINKLHHLWMVELCRQLGIWNLEFFLGSGSWSTYVCGWRYDCLCALGNQCICCSQLHRFWFGYDNRKPILAITLISLSLVFLATYIINPLRENLTNSYCKIQLSNKNTFLSEIKLASLNLFGFSYWGHTSTTIICSHCVSICSVTMYTSIVT